MDIDDDSAQDVNLHPPIFGDDAQEAHSAAAPTSGSPSESPEMVGHEEMEDMRSRALAIKAAATPGDEQAELADMVLRLTSTGITLKSQLMEQAETIADLSRQREYILEREEEEKVRWIVERESWHRVADALLKQANKPATPSIYKDPTKPTPFLESDNNMLKSKLSEAQQRLASLETELAQLKPILLLRPFTLTHSVKPENRSEASAVAGPSKLNTKTDSVNETTPKADNTQRLHLPAVTNHPSIVHKSKNSSAGKHGPTYADARSEHLLLAARRIGRERAAFLSSSITEDLGSALVMSPSVAKGKGKADEPHPHAMPGNPYTLHYPTTPTPKTPQKASPIGVAAYGSPGAGLHYPPPGRPFLVHSPMQRLPGGPHPPQFTYVSGPIPGPAYALYSPAYGYGPMPAPGGSPSRPTAAKPSTSPSVRAPAPSPRASTSKATTDEVVPEPRPKRVAGKRKTQPSLAIQPVASSSKISDSHTKSANGPTSAVSPPSAFDLLHTAAHSVLRSPSAGAASLASPGSRTKRVVEEEDADSETSRATTRKRTRMTSDYPIRDPRGNKGIGRASSALDVLADQAVIFGSQSTRSRAHSVVSHSRSGSEHSLVESVHGSSMSSASQSPTLLPARWDKHPRLLASNSRPSMDPPKATVRRNETVTPKPKRGRAVKNGQSSRNSNSRLAGVKDHNNTDGASASESDTETGKQMAVDEEPETSTPTAPSTKNNTKSNKEHEKLRREWLKKLGRFAK